MWTAPAPGVSHLQSAPVPHLPRSKLIQGQTNLLRSKLTEGQANSLHSKLTKDQTNLLHSKLTKDQTYMLRSMLTKDQTHLLRSKLTKRQTNMLYSMLTRDLTNMLRSMSPQVPRVHLPRGKWVPSTAVHGRVPVLSDVSFRLESRSYFQAVSSRDRTDRSSSMKGSTPI